MTSFLLDVNVLIALIDPVHLHMTGHTNVLLRWENEPGLPVR